LIFTVEYEDADLHLLELWVARLHQGRQVAAARRGSSGWRGGERVRCLRWAQLLTSGGRLYRSEMRRETCTERAAALCGRLRRRAAAPSGDEKRETCVEQAAMLSRWLLASGKRRASGYNEQHGQRLVVRRRAHGCACGGQERLCWRDGV
jgi:hypothetical protein